MEAFVYRDGDVVLRDVTRVVVHPSVRVLPRNVFNGCEKLKEVQLNENLEKIGNGAFHNGCEKFEEVQLNQGLEEIRYGAFRACVSLRRLNIPSTVVWIRGFAFAYCRKLKEIRLNEGLKGIGRGAFHGCRSLRRLNCPSTVRRIEDRAFGDCRSLSVVELAGTLNVEGSAFVGCSEIQIQVPSRAFVVQQGNCRLVTDGTIAPSRDEFVLVAPECLAALSESNLAELGNSIGAIMNNGEGTERERIDQVRQEVRREVGGEVSAILGLAFWKAKIDAAERTRIGADVLTQKVKERCRGEGKEEKVIAQSIFPFLVGPRGNGSQGGP